MAVQAIETIGRVRGPGLIGDSYNIIGCTVIIISGIVIGITIERIPGFQ